MPTQDRAEDRTTQRRPRAAPGHGDRLRSELIETARTILAREMSVDAVTLRGVARELGITAPSIYLHFKTRDDLVMAAVAAQFDRLRVATVSAAEEAGSSLAKLRASMVGYCRFAEEDPGGYAVLFSRPLPVELLTESADASFVALVVSIMACIDEGALPASDAFVTARRAWTTLHGMMALRAVMPHFPWNPVEDAVDELLSDLGASSSR